MKELTAKEFMLQVRRARKELELIGEKKRKYYELATNIGVNLTGMPGGQKGASKVEAGAIGVVDLIAGLESKEQAFTALIVQADEMIEKIPQENFRTVLTLRYMLDKKWPEIAEWMGYKDEKSAQRCHGYALKEIQGMLKEITGADVNG